MGFVGNSPQPLDVVLTVAKNLRGKSNTGSGEGNLANVPLFVVARIKTLPTRMALETGIHRVLTNHYEQPMLLPQLWHK